MLPASVLIIDSDPGVVNAFAKSLGRQGIVVYGTTSAYEGREVLHQEKPQALILDLQFPDQPGLEFLHETRIFYPALPIIVITRYSTSFTEADARREGAAGYFVKPFDLNALIEKLQTVVFNNQDATAKARLVEQREMSGRDCKIESSPQSFKEGVCYMKRSLVLLAAIGALGFASGLRAAEFKQERMNINVWSSGITSVRGHFGPDVKSTAFLQAGPDFGIAWQYFPRRSFGVQAAYELGWQNVEKAYRNDAGATPAFVVHQITLSGLYNLIPGSRWRPYVGVGIGLYPFRLSQDGVSGDAEKLANGNELKRTSFGLNGNAGVEFSATKRFAIIGSAHYNYLFAKDDQKFGADSNFSDQALFSYGLGLSYHFGLVQ
jgi:DNA-binding response OmpR family regulator